MNQKVRINYTNWQGETRDRIVTPKRIIFGHSAYHGEDQWLLDAWDEEKSAWRLFSMKDIHSWQAINS